MLKMICWLSGYCKKLDMSIIGRLQVQKTHILIPSYYVHALNLTGYIYCLYPAMKNSAYRYLSPPTNVASITEDRLCAILQILAAD